VCGSGICIDIIYSNTSTPDDFELRGGSQYISGDLRGTAYYEGCIIADNSSQFLRFQASLNINAGVGQLLPQEIDALSRDVIGNEYSMVGDCRALFHLYQS
jgi:hypothetical protein